MTRLYWCKVLSICSICAAQLLVANHSDSAEPKFKKGARIISNIGTADLVSEDGQVVSVLFDAMLIGTNPGTHMPLVVTRTATLHVPMQDNDQDMGVIYDIRGFVNTTKSAHATLLFQACGKATLVDLNKAIKDAKSNTVPKPKREPKKPAEMTTADDFYVRLRRTLPSKSEHNVTIFMLAEKDTDDEALGAALYVDSIDMSLGN